jgi:superfamily I DNA/RNA helicase
VIFALYKATGQAFSDYY